MLSSDLAMQPVKQSQGQKCAEDRDKSQVHISCHIMSPCDSSLRDLGSQTQKLRAQSAIDFGFLSFVWFGW